MWASYHRDPGLVPRLGVVSSFSFFFLFCFFPSPTASSSSSLPSPPLPSLGSKCQRYAAQSSHPSAFLNASRCPLKSYDSQSLSQWLMCVSCSQLNVASSFFFFFLFPHGGCRATRCLGGGGGRKRRRSQHRAPPL